MKRVLICFASALLGVASGVAAGAERPDSPREGSQRKGAHQGADALDSQRAASRSNPPSLRNRQQLRC